MVVFELKSGNDDSFLYEVPCDTENVKVISDIVELWNLRIRLRQLVGAIRELALYGPMKKSDQAGLDHIDESFKGMTIEKNEFYLEDPTGLRNGNGPGPKLSETLERVAADAEAALDRSLASRKVAISLAFLRDKLDNIRGAVTMAYPMGLPEWDTIRMTIEGNHGLEGTAAGQEILDTATAEVWVASRCLDRSQKISDRFGKNEKTKVVAKLQRPGAGAPGREPGISEEEKKAMMAYYFKKQEEMKKLSENNEDDFINSAWADPKQLQRSLRGQGSAVKAPGIL